MRHLPVQPPARPGVLLANVGSPAAPTPAALRPYLAQFLSDRRIVDYPRWLWLPILHALILRARPRRSARLYARIWTEAGSPLVHTLQVQAGALRAALTSEFGQSIPVAIGLRYGEPSIALGLRELHAAGADGMVVFPLYPQYSTTTTASVFDGVDAELAAWPRRPAIRVIERYGTQPAYIEALAASVCQFWSAHGRGDRLLMSFHGIPRRYASRGDPYPTECAATAQQLAAALGLRDPDWFMAYQSRFGPEPWLQPYTDRTLAAWGRAGLRRVDVIAPGFSADCLETLGELAHEAAHTFVSAGGGELHYIPALNDLDVHVAALANVVTTALTEWIIPLRRKLAGMA
jgi:ferrochelatase